MDRFWSQAYAMLCTTKILKFIVFPWPQSADILAKTHDIAEKSITYSIRQNSIYPYPLGSHISNQKFRPVQSLSLEILKKKHAAFDVVSKLHNHPNLHSPVWVGQTAVVHSERVQIWVCVCSCMAGSCLV